MRYMRAHLEGIARFKQEPDLAKKVIKKMLRLDDDSFSAGIVGAYLPNTGSRAVSEHQGDEDKLRIRRRLTRPDVTGSTSRKNLSTRASLKSSIRADLSRSFTKNRHERMKVRIGIALGQWPSKDIKPEAIFDLVEHFEKLDVDSLWMSDRLVSAALIFEPITFLSYIAGRLSKMKFGTSTLVLPTRNPVVLAKELATLDFLSHGRLFPAFGLGGDESRDLAAVGVSRKERAARADEMIALMRRLWTEEKVTFEGKFYAVKDVTIMPRPWQKEWHSDLDRWAQSGSHAAHGPVGRRVVSLVSFTRGSRSRDQDDSRLCCRSGAQSSGRSLRCSDSVLRCRQWR